jgi:hypothetical protein
LKAVLAAAAAALLTGGLAPALLAGGAEASGTTAFTSFHCTGVAGDGTTINSDLSALSEGGTLLVAGNCGASGSLLTISLPSGVTLRGTEGSDPNIGTTIFGHIAGASGNAESNTVEDLQVNCGGSGVAVKLDGWRENVNHITTTNCVTGIELDNSSQGTGNRVNSLIENNFLQVTGSTGYPFYINDASPGNGVTDGVFAHNHLSGGAESIKALNSAGWSFLDNHSYNQAGTAFELDRCWACRVSGNYIESWSGAGDFGIYAQIQSGAVGATITGNAVFQNDAGTTGSGGTTGGGIGVQGNGTPALVTVTGNTIVNTLSSNTSNYGIQGDGSGLTFITAGNAITGAGTPVGATSSATHSAGQ